METVGRLEPDGIILHSHYIESGTTLHRYCQNAPWKLLTETEINQHAVQCLELFPEDAVIQHLVGEVVTEQFVAPEWSKKKQCVINHIQDKLEQWNTCHGARYVPNCTMA